MVRGELMPIRFYVIPMEPGPYSRDNGQRPMYLDALQANWSGYPLFQWDRYLCQVNTTPAKHTILDAQAGVIGLPDIALSTLVAGLPLAARTRISTFLGNIGIPYEPDETVGDLIQRVIAYAEFRLGNDARDTVIGTLSQAKRDRIATLMAKFDLAYSELESIGTVVVRARARMWEPTKTMVGEF
jgi:hypothetical protein